LESTLTDPEGMKNAIKEAINVSNQEDDIDFQTDKITDDLYNTLIAEMKLELDLLLLTDPHRLQQPEGIIYIS
jgi:hypothetical protein